jgi:hypothetical protein
MSNIPVNDKEIVKINIVNNVDIRVMNLDLGKSVDVNAVMRQGEQLIDVKNFHITGQEYDDWGQDDQYIENLVLTKLGLTRKS